ncbi:MAG: DNA-directed RNA polymerase subunit beta', partial [Oscillospiraceae bacterium]|nr:DNA-directed RNA polymerase subunit beta' [Oscillospiraceae bacterium]MCI9308524.1 DNA-directed RNA polymerase subunit beta' [Oscillospiraceae bacterium]
RPFVMKKLVESGISNIKAAKKEVDKGTPAVWDALESVIKEHPVMLNRAPTLHRLGIQAFEPVLVEGRAMKLHPLVCTAFNADFDGDQMAIHVPLSAEAQAEARILMLAANNLLKPSDGGPVTVPTQDMVLGSYYLTYERDPEPDPDFSYQTPAEAAKALADGQLMENDRVWVQDEEMGRWYRTTPALCAEAKDGKAEEVYNVFSDDNEAQLAYAEGILDLHEPIMVRRSAQIDGEVRHKLVRTTVGRLLFNEGIPQDLEFVDRNDPEQVFEPEINFMCGKKQLGQIVDRCISKHGFTRSAEVLDTIKARGYKFSTRGALTVAIADMTVPDEKRTLIAKTEQDIVKIENQYKRGFLTNDERYRLVVSAWEKTTNEVSDALQASMDKFNPIFMMADSGARGSMKQIRQLAGMRGLMADTAGRTIEIPIKANFREGLSVLEYFISSRGARKGMADTALRTADSGYLTRRLVDVSQEVIIREDDCGTTDGITVSEIGENGQVIEPLVERLKGRYLAEDLIDRETGQVLVGRNTLVDGELAKFIEEKLVEQAGPDGRPAIKVRSVLTCEAHSGVCAKCYGMNLAFSEPVGMGEAVGIIAAQSIGEPGTQLTMRTFHTGGVAGGDITQGLPRVEELLEARKPKKMAQLAEISGVVTVEETKRTTLCNLTITADDGEVVTYAVPYSSGIRVKNGDRVTKGQRLTDGALSPHEVLRIRGVDAVHNYLIQEVQKPYRQQGVDINDKHIEVIVRQMMRKVRVEESGDSDLLSGSTVDIIEYRDACAAVRARIAAGEKREDGEELVLPTCTRLLLGITKASLATESFLSAASFQETTKVLTEAAIKGKVDHLLGLKENVIIGKLIPAGSGLAAYRKLDEIEDEVHDEGRFREVAVLADDLREDEEPSAPAEADEADEAAEEEDEVLSVTLEDEDEVPEDGEE